jgi:hypothetical protein
VLMMTPPDKKRNGNTSPTLFGAREGIIKLCDELHSSKNPQIIKSLPVNTGSSYSIVLHEPVEFSKSNREAYFTKFPSQSRQLIFLDPDIGFDLSKSCTENHVRFSEIKDILNQLPEESVISVFQHFRRVPFSKDFKQITDRLENLNTTAIYWNPVVMFVVISKSKEAVARVVEANKKYTERYPFLRNIRL